MTDVSSSQFSFSIAEVVSTNRFVKTLVMARFTSRKLAADTSVKARFNRYSEGSVDDVLLKLNFQAGTMDLPFHSHDHSDRVILVAEGAGQFHIKLQRSKSEKMIEIRTRDALVFARGTVHTFRVPEDDLVLLSYHSPFIKLDDPRQYTIVDDDG